MKVQFLLLAILWRISSGYATKRWCRRNETTISSIVTQSRQEEEINCLDFYKYAQIGWKYDDVRMKEQHGQTGGVTSYFQTLINKALCYIYKPEQRKEMNVTKTILGCCDGWSGSHCLHRKALLGTCYYDNRCRLPSYMTSAVPYDVTNRSSTERKFSREVCCGLLGSVAWISENSDDSGKCVQCKTTQGVSMEPSDKATCVILNGDYVISFNNHVLKMRNDCAFQLLGDLDQDWTIDVQNDACDDPTHCSKKLRISLRDDVILSLSSNCSFINDATITTPDEFYKHGITFTRTEKFFSVETSFGVRLSWDGESVIFITIDNGLEGKVIGLCGGEASARWRRGDIKTSSDTSQSKVEASIDYGCHNTVINDITCDDTHSDVYARNVCGFLFEEEAFVDCRQSLDPTPFYEVCRMAVCERMSSFNNQSDVILCQSAMTYMLQCAASGVEVGQWMGKRGCQWGCPQGMEFTQCATKCPATCNSPQIDTSLYCHDNCLPGCQCQEGAVLQVGASTGFDDVVEVKCHSPDLCPCIHRGQTYKRHESLTKDCNTCVCGTNGAWNCSTNRCHAICHVISAVNVVTFDDSRLRLKRSNCLRHILVKSNTDSDVFLQVEADIITSQIDEVLPEIRLVRISHGEDLIKVERNLNVFVNASEVHLPYRNNRFSIRYASTHSLIFTSLGFSLIWIPMADSLDVVLEPMFANKVLGICGTFSWNSKDDFMTPEGDIEAIPELFVKSFLLKDKSDECSSSDVTWFAADPCSTHTQRRDYAKKVCDVLHDVIFEECHSVVDVADYETTCIHDVCRVYDVHPKFACRSLTSYAFKCLQSGAKSTSQLLSWRQHRELNGECDVTCPSGLQFAECQPIAFTSCDDVSRPLPSYSDVGNKLICVPGCRCPNDGKVTPMRELLEYDDEEGIVTQGYGSLKHLQDGLRCVRADECPCYNRGRIFPPGHLLRSGCTDCVCSVGRWNCSSEKCGATIRCSNNMIFSHKVTPCDLLTCHDKQRIALLHHKGDCDDEISYEGCMCPRGMVLKDNQCIDRDDCPCHHAGRFYDGGSTLARECNTCICAKGKWNCSKLECSANCVVTGDAHYVTFDGAFYSFQGRCSYVIVRENSGLFQVTAENIPCGTSGVVCTKSIYVTIGHVTVHLLRGKRVTVNGARVGKLPRHYGSDVIGDDTTYIDLYQAGLFLIVNWPKLGFTIYWDGGTRVQIRLTPQYMGKVSGLCGNYDMTIRNDFTTRLGSLETSMAIFTQAWKTSPVCFETTHLHRGFNMNPCESNEHRVAWARHKCSIITSGEIFEECRNVVPPPIYYNWCVHDACACNAGGDCECACTAIAAYARACSDQHVYVRWRSQALCPIQCEGNKVYMECGPACQESCTSNDTSSRCKELPCVEGCFCAPGFVTHGRRCVKRSECPCAWENGEYEPGTTVLADCQNCTCHNGEWTCQGEKCDSLLPSCDDDKLLCEDKISCVPLLWRCDFEADCMDGSDESDCDWSEEECRHAGGHVCGSGQCVLPAAKCNGVSDCLDTSDEFDCDVTNFTCDGFLCNNGKCIKESLVCDGRLSCGFGDFSDELSCKENCSLLRHFTCNNGDCISRRAYCDGRPDCDDHSDEINCVCPTSYFTCADEECVEREKLCDSIEDCAEGEDELECIHMLITPTTSSTTTLPTTSLEDNTTECPEFHCNYDVSKCVQWGKVCDNNFDCLDHSDETEECWSECAETELSCDGGLRCLDVRFLCDGFNQCEDASDEEHCDVTTSSPSAVCIGEFRCSDGVCINGSMICDAIIDCETGDDEIGCNRAATMTTTTSDEEIAPTVASCKGYMCRDGRCIHLEQVCDDVSDCQDHLDDELMTSSDSPSNVTSSDEVGCAMWGAWDQWGDCSHSCGSGVQLRNRTCPSMHEEDRHVTKKDPLRGECKGKVASSRPCFIDDCPSKGNELTDWSDWSLCSATCGGGITSRWRSCSDGTQNCTLAQPRGRFRQGVPLLEMQSCAEKICPDQECVGNKAYYDCGSDNKSVSSYCPLTCRDLIRGGKATCVTTKANKGCQQGCHCPPGYVTINKSSTQCVTIGDCPCYENGKTYERGDEVRRKDTCQICRCSGGGRLRDCRDDPSCDVTKLCGWSEWSDWGPCFGPCGVNGVQWAFRSPFHPSRYGQKRQCQGSYRKSRRCPSAQCKTCDVNNTSRKVGEQWKISSCRLCKCKDDRTVDCVRFCKFATIGCPGNQTLVEPIEEENCCYCQDTNKSEPWYPPQSNREKSEEFTNKTAFPGSTYTGSATLPSCGVTQHRCKQSHECLPRSFLCDDVTHCIDGSDEDEELCRHPADMNEDHECRFSDWSKWTPCSHTCGMGQEFRHRGLRSTMTSSLENTCVGPVQAFRPCFLKSCPRHGSWSPWQRWSRCSRTCGGGIQARKRFCDSPAPLNSGIECPGVNLETRLCNPGPCVPGLCSGGKILLNGTECPGFELCSQSCADLSSDVRCKSECLLRNNEGGCFCPTGKYFQDGNCVTQEKCRCSINRVEHDPGSRVFMNGCECICTNGVAQCSMECNLDCGWSAWTTWSHCDRTCGVAGWRHRFRSPNNPSTVGARGKKCSGGGHETKTCSYTPCPPTWGEWGYWGQCSSSCGVGRQIRRRQCEVDGQKASTSFCTLGGNDVTYRQSKICTNVDDVTECKTCLSNMVYKCVKCPRTCDDVSTNVTKRCLQKCAWTCACKEGKYLQGKECLPLSNCSCHVIDHVKSSTANEKLQPGESFQTDCNTCTCVNGSVICTNESCSSLTVASWEWSPWSRWSRCSRTCVDISNITSTSLGVKTRYRQCLPKHDVSTDDVISGLCAGPREQSSQCGLTLCLPQSSWMPWSAWSDCDRTCGGGVQRSSRKCRDRSELGRVTCEGTDVKARACNLRPCRNEKCPAGSIFVPECQPPCGIENTCQRMVEDTSSEKYCNHGNRSICDVGYCKCINDLMWQDGECVPHYQCNCYVMKKVYKSNSTFSIGSCTTCQCLNGALVCRPKTSSNGSSVCDVNQPCYDDASSGVTWTSWTSCSKSCDVGVRRRFSVPPNNGMTNHIGSWCRHSTEQQEDCNVMSCTRHNADCGGDCYVPSGNTSDHNFTTGWGWWSSWGACSTTCVRKSEDSWRHRYRKCYTANNSYGCVGSDSQTSLCDVSLLPSCDHDEIWKQWSDWSACSVTCSGKGALYQTRIRVCKGSDCVGSGSERKLCPWQGNLNNCYNGTLPPTSDQECANQINGSRFERCGPECATTCSGTQICSKTCQPGCHCPPGKVLNFGGKSCVELSRCKCFSALTRKYYQPRERFILDGSFPRNCSCDDGIIQCEDYRTTSQLYQWSHWTACSRSCGKQERFRYRSCPINASLSYNTSDVIGRILMGPPSAGIQVEKSQCRIYPNCTEFWAKPSPWGEWGAWTGCTCMTSHMTRRRACNNMTSCKGPRIQTKPCRYHVSKCDGRCPSGLTLDPCPRSNCVTSCFQLSSEAQCVYYNVTTTGSDRQRRWDRCVPQCTCPDDLLINPTNQEGVFECVPPEQCSCFLFDDIITLDGTNKMNDVVLRIGVNKTFQNSCKNCTCHHHADLNCEVIKSSLNDSACTLKEENRKWKPWSGWSECSQSCNSGIQFRVRVCEHPPCAGANEQTQNCNNDVSCSMTSWEAWSACSKSCGYGVKSRSRQCRAGHRCGEDKLLQLNKCYADKSCPPSYTNWSPWSSCDVSCGLGHQLRHKECRNSTDSLPRYLCEEGLRHSDVNSTSSKEMRQCFGKACSDVRNTSYGWTEWSSWSLCEGGCGKGIQRKSRRCISHRSVPNNTDVESNRCTGDPVTRRRCSSLPCPDHSSSAPCPPGMTSERLCDNCLRNDDGMYYRQPLSCVEMTSGPILPCNATQCREVCVCNGGKILQTNAEESAQCVAPAHCECRDQDHRVFPPGARWIVTSRNQAGNVCTANCSCSAGRVICVQNHCTSRDLCSWSEWGAWTSCNSSCYDHTSPTARFRFRASNASSNADGVCGDDAMQAEHCNDIIPCPIENATYNVTNTSCSEDCPEITCRDSEVKSRKEGDCCMTCQAEIDEGSFHACAARSEIKNFSLDGCESRDINITYCAGYCHSSVHVIPYAPYFHQSCDCCSYHVDNEHPHITVTLECADKDDVKMNLPNISRCSCDSCTEASNLMKLSEP
ncbi:unnamed protein product [Clavelina lepadiformis]|uniref:SCO-spondin n=1 Tax=Clavelina lepadiformis TaxID=159417 RepID=A0ABP0GL60_CLALP